MDEGVVYCGCQPSVSPSHTHTHTHTQTELKVKVLQGLSSELHTLTEAVVNITMETAAVDDKVLAALVYNTRRSVRFCVSLNLPTPKLPASGKDCQSWK